MSLIPKEFMNSVVLISSSDGQYTKYATGFFIGRRIKENNFCIYLVTNKHVIENEKSLNIKMISKNKQDTNNITVNLFDEKGNPNFYLSLDENLDVDVTVIKLPCEIGNSNFNFINIDENSLTSKELINDDNAEGSLVYMLGFPLTGDFDNSSLKPIVRLGCIARMNEKEIFKSHYAWADIQNFKGNSGSPIFIRPEIMHLDGTKPLNKVALIGVVSNYAYYKNKVKDEEMKETESYIEENSGLAGFVPVEFIIQILDKIQPKIICEIK